MSYSYLELSIFLFWSLFALESNKLIIQFFSFGEHGDRRICDKSVMINNIMINKGRECNLKH